MLKPCPDLVDVLELQIKLKCRLKIFDNKTCEIFKEAHNLIACASRYGLVFLGTHQNEFQAIRTLALEEYNVLDKDVTDYPRRTINLPGTAKHLSVNCDNTILAVAIEVNNIPSVLFYDVTSFIKQNLLLIKEMKVSQTPVKILSINWNPTIPGTFTLCKSDGSLGVYEITTQNIISNELPPAAGICSFCWSPKGKQVAVGSKDGKITQYKPDLKAVKVIEAPPLPSPHSLKTLQWVSNFQFIGVYCSNEDEPKASIIVVEAPKTGPITYTNYDDICYSNGNNRDIQFYINFQLPWNLLMIASSNSTEVGILSHVGESWIQWVLSDNARAELPLNSNHEDTYPVGMDLDLSSTKSLTWGEETLPPSPILMLLSHEGLLCMFNVINLKPGIPSLCSPPDVLQDTSGLSLFTIPNVTKPQAISFATTNSFPIVSSTNDNLVTSSMMKPPPISVASSLFEPKIPFGTSISSTIPELQNKFPQTNIPSKQFSFGKDQPLNLFGGQISLTPIKPKDAASNVINKNTTAPTIISTTTLPLNSQSSIINNPKYSTVFSAIQDSVPISAHLPASNSTVSIISKPLQSNIKSELKPQLVKKVEPVQVVETLETFESKQETEHLLADMIKNECDNLEDEVKNILFMGKSVKINLGTDSEKNNILNTIHSLGNFVEEISEIGNTQSAEIHYLKQNLIQSWAWFEEGRSRYNSSKDETMNFLLRAQPLDSASEKILTDIVHHMCYLDSQLKEASKALDEQWESFQDYARKTHKIYTPTMEAIFQLMVRQNAILQRQTYVMKDISNRIKVKTRANTKSSLLMSMGNLDVTDDFRKLNLVTPDIYQVQYEQILIRRQQFSLQKSLKLRNFLKKREISHVTVSKPQLTNSLLHQTPVGKSKHLISILGAQMSPVPKPVPKIMPFIQSTPKKESSSTNLITSVKVPATENSTAQFSFSHISLSQPAPSAFVPTQSSTSFVAIKQKSNTETVSPHKTVVITTWGGDNFSKTVSTFCSPTNKSVPQPTFSSNMFGSKSNTHISTISHEKFGPLPMLTPPNQQKILHSSTFNSDQLKVPQSASIFNVAPPSQTSTFKISGTATLTTSSSINTSKPSAFTMVNSSENSQSIARPFASGNDSNKPLFTFNINKFSSPDTCSTPLQSDKSDANLTVDAPSKTVASISSLTTENSKPTLIASAAFFPSTISNTTTASITFDSSTKVSSGLNVKFTTAPTSTSNVTSSFFEKGIESTTSTFKDGITFKTSSNKDENTIKTNTTDTVFSKTMESTVCWSPNQATNAGTNVFVKSTGLAQSPVTTNNMIGPPASSTSSNQNILNLSSKSDSSTSLASNVSTPSTNIFGAALQKSEVSGFPVTNTTPVTQNIFGGSLQKSEPYTTITTSGHFSNPPESGFISKSTTAFDNTSGNSIFDAKSTASIFNSTSITTTNIFGSGVQTSDTEPKSLTTNIFGQSSQETTPTSGFSTKPLFGSVATTQGSIFGTAPSVASTTTTHSIFGATNSSTPFAVSGTSPFGQQQSSVFGTPSTSSSGFGTNSVFGNANTFSDSTRTQNTFRQSNFGVPQSIFGSTTTTSSVFGNTSTTTTNTSFGGGSIFGTPASNSSASIFGSAATEPSSSFSFASAGANTQNQGQTVSFGSLSMGGTNNTTTTASNVFGGQSTFGAQSSNPFGRTEAVATTGNLFGSPVSTSNTVFGGTTSGSIFGGSAFGSSAFGSTASQGSSNFGASQPGPFSAGGNAFGSTQSPGPFSTGGTSPSIAQSGFGSPPSFSKPAFGGSFGSPPAFGSGPSFGGAPTFGNQSFGSPNKIFGSSTPANAFGSPVTQTSTFGNLATQNTVGFGNLAQQSGGSANSNTFSGGSSFSSWR